jgi:hypothetical protein
MTWNSTAEYDALVRECKDHIVYSRRFNVSNRAILEELVCDFELDRKTAEQLIRSV